MPFFALLTRLKKISNQNLKGWGDLLCEIMSKKITIRRLEFDFKFYSFRTFQNPGANLKTKPN
jgi:hypothetical protein